QNVKAQAGECFHSRQKVFFVDMPIGGLEIVHGQLHDGQNLQVLVFYFLNVPLDLSDTFREDIDMSVGHRAEGASLNQNGFSINRVGDVEDFIFGRKQNRIGQSAANQFQVHKVVVKVS